MSRVRFAVLGPLSVLVDGEPVQLAPKLRVVLATLLLRAGRAVPVEALADRIWGERLPVDPRASLQTYITRLRTALGDAGELLRTSPGGYLIQVGPGQLDLAEFRALVAQAELSGGDDEREAGLLRTALDLWQGPPLSDIASDVLRQLDLPALTELWISVLERRIDSDLRLGEHARLVPELRSLTAAHPLWEPLWSRLMLALYRCGRQADALAAYDAARRLLVDELGLDPGAELRELRQAILQADAALDLAVEPAQQDWVAHNQLPLEVSRFTGRSALVGEVEKLLTEGSEGVKVVALVGPPGIGKSALALHVAHGIRDVFPDGQWYLQLAGADRPRESSVLLAELLVSSGIEPGQVPETADARSALLRSRLADRQVLLVLDDAGDAEQVRPLLPGTGGNAVLVTSRHALGGLVALDGAHRLTVQELTPDDSRLLLDRLFGHRLATPSEMTELADLCGHLPLALRIAAANLSTRPDTDLTSYLAGLRAAPLARLSVRGDPDTAVRRAFERSYRALAEDSARLFRLLGLMPGADFTVETAVALTGSQYSEGERLLEVLAEASLVQEHRLGRYQFHDLLRRYAEELGEADPGGDEAKARLRTAYLLKAATAVGVMAPGKLRLPLPDLPELPGRPPALERPEAIEWLQAEVANLVALTVAAEGLPEAWYLADQVSVYCAYWKRRESWQGVIEVGMRAARLAGDRLAMGAMQRALAVMMAGYGQTAESQVAMREALPHYRAAGYLRGEVSVLNWLGINSAHLGEFEDALDWFEQSVATARQGTDRRAQAMAAGNIAALLCDLGRNDEAMTVLVETMTEFESLDDTDNVMLHMLAVIQQDLGDLEAARSSILAELENIRRHGRQDAIAMSTETLASIQCDAGEFSAAELTALDALEITQSIGDRRIESHVQATLADAILGLDRTDEAIDRYHVALSLARDTGNREVEIRALAGLARGRLALGDHALALSTADEAAQRAENFGKVPLRDQVLATAASVRRAVGEADQVSGT